MPGRSGVEISTGNRVKFPNTAVVMASCVTDTNIIARCVKGGAQDYIFKPFRLDDVLFRVSIALEKKKLEHKFESIRCSMKRMVNN